MRELIKQTVSSITPFDQIEKQHITETIQWIDSGQEIFRIKKPDVPNKHLVSYFVLLDEIQKKILLVDHKLAMLLLPTGGHVEINEHPAITVQRECQEELGIEAIFWQEPPLFLTLATTVGKTAGHTDVTLWYVLKGHTEEKYSFDDAEFNSITWFQFDQIPYSVSDPNMQRFITKLNDTLECRERNNQCANV